MFCYSYSIFRNLSSPRGFREMETYSLERKLQYSPIHMSLLKILRILKILLVANGFIEIVILSANELSRFYNYKELFVIECVDHGLHWNHKTQTISEKNPNTENHRTLPRQMRKSLSKYTNITGYKLESLLSFTMIIVYQLIFKMNVVPCTVQNVCSVGIGKVLLTLK